MTFDALLQLLNDLLAIFFLIAGLFFMAVGVIGLIRLPDVYHRIHAVSKCSTLGMAGMILAAMFHLGTLDVVAKGVMTLIFAFVAMPVGSHMLAKAALRARAQLWEGTIDDEHATDTAAGPAGD